jgi:hypothetical protein
MKKGTVVYRVVEWDLPDAESDFTWKAQAVEIERASNIQIKLKKPFSDMSSKIFKPSALGRVFHETPLQAIQHFMAECRLKVDELERKRSQLERAIMWAYPIVNAPSVK